MDAAPLDVAWPIVGTSKNITYLSVDQAEAIHFELVRDFAEANDPIEPPGIRSRALLESAVHRPYTSLGGHQKYPTVEMAGAALFHALVLDHPFHNGNKRTAVVSLIAFADMNGLILDVEDNELFEYVVKVAAHSLLGKATHRGGDLADQEMLEISDWVCSKTRKAERTEFPLQFRELRAILRRYGADFQILSGNRINIRIGDLKTQIGYQGEGRDIDRNAVHKVRQDLHLDEEHHIDSAIFYREHREIPAFIVSYRDVLSRLARV
jgi:death-on-curing family protein